jgi:hypothetical protein
MIAYQVFPWRYEYRHGTGWAANRPGQKFLPVTVAVEPSTVVVVPVAASMSAPTSVAASIHIELPGRALVSVEADVDPEVVRSVFRSLLG